MRAPRVVQFQSLKSLGKIEHLLWSYCGIHRSPINETQPSILISLRKKEDEGWSDNLYYRRIPLTGMGHARIGTIWQDGKSREQLVFKEKKFDVDFTAGKWKIRSFDTAHQSTVSDPYPFSLYPHKHRRDKNFCLLFPVPDEGRVVIPCLEFFARCYGGSGELRRVLTTFLWSGPTDPSSKLYAPLEEAEEPDTWKVKLRKRLTNRDVIILAHAKYNSYTEKVVKNIYSNLEANYRFDKPDPAFIQISPWYQGPAKLLVSGIEFNEGRSFLALNILGASDPHDVLIQRDRENANNALLPAGGTQGEAWKNAQKRRLVRVPDIALFVAGDPDHTSENIEVIDPDFIILGDEREIVDVRRDKAQSTAGIKKEGEPAEGYSGGDQHGANKGVGHVSVRTNFELESEGVLKDMWRALQQLHRDFPALVSPPESCDSAGVFSATDQLIPLIEIADDKEVENKVRNWVYIDRSPATPRGILVARTNIDNRYVYLLEIQRKTTITFDADGNMSDREESYQGLVCSPNEGESFKNWLDFVRTAIPEVTGIVKHLEGQIIRDAYAFKHSTSGKEKISGEASLRNALSKVAIAIADQLNDVSKAGSDTTAE